MAGTKDQIVCDAQAIVNIVAGTSSLEQEYQTTVFTSCTCSACYRTYWRLVKNREEYLSLYPHCPNCGNKIGLYDVTEDHDIIGAEVQFLQKENAAYASFKLTYKALETQNIKHMIQKCNARYIW
ncbi:unnamed protein product [Adineta steineri]|uniref:Uncharacterized protein n=1 Tax=Adineta steineri TaxID=433720 RepID=A0A814K8S0_9BILA|nr:unnamed protein product [Adineta steineri]CAF0939268.1 unnamed protein product [Adineta steineri]CAF1046068.1 unnamed protein product [Adineta steineri]